MSKQSVNQHHRKQSIGSFPHFCYFHPNADCGISCVILFTVYFPLHAILGIENIWLDYSISSFILTGRPYPKVLTGSYWKLPWPLIYKGMFIFVCLFIYLFLQNG